MIWLIILVMITSLPVGYLLAYLCREELVPGRKWFISLGVISFASAILLIIFYRKLEIILILIYIGITSLINLYLSYNKKFVRKR